MERKAVILIKMSIKKDLTGKQYVPGNIKDFLQVYRILYYYPEANFPTDKIWIYLDGEENGQPRMIRSLCFKNPENHQKFIMNNIYAHIFQLIQRAGDHIPEVQKSRYQMALLNNLLVKIRGEISKKFKEEIKLTV